jgi:hypothetical protein
VILLSGALAALWLVPTSAASQSASSVAAADQVLTWTAGDSMTDYNTAPTEATAGAATIVFENSTATGNMSGMSHTLTFDTSTPGYNHDVDVNIVASPYDSDGGRHEVEVNLTPGKYRYFCAIPGHGEMVGEFVVTDGGGDTTAPEVSAEVTGDQDADGNYIGSATVAVSASDADSGVDTVEYEIDDTGFQAYTEPVTVTEPGDHAVQYRATDTAGNLSETGSVPFRIVEPAPEDTTAPEVSAEVTGDQDAEGNYVGSATVAISAQDADSGVAAIEYEVDGGNYAPYTEPVVVTAPGAHTVSYRATDNAGNTSEAGSVTFTVAEPAPDDTTAPEVSAEITGDQDADGNYIGSATVTLAASDADSGVDTVEYNLDGGGFAAYTEPVVVSAPGEHTVQYRATDNSGNTSEAGSVTFTVAEPAPDDTTAPEVSAEITGDQDADGNYIGSATVTLAASDADSGVDTVEYEIDDTGFQAYTGPVTVDEPGDHSVQYRATDNSGNVSEIGSVIFVVVEPAPDDTTAPEVSAEVSGDQDADGNYIGFATVTVDASDADSGIDTVHIAIDGGAYAPYTEPVVVTAPGAHRVNYRATDNAGNTSEVESVTFTVAEPAPDDTTAPEVSADVSGDQDADGNYIGSATVTLDASDEGSGVFALRYSLDGGSFTPYNEPLVITEPGEHTVLYRATDNSGNALEDGSVTFSVIASDSDGCPGSDIRDTVIIGDNDSTVANVDTGDGCTINDLIDEDGEYANHGKFVKHVRQVTDALVADGIISDQEKGRIMNAAARSDVGKK